MRRCLPRFDAVRRVLNLRIWVLLAIAVVAVGLYVLDPSQYVLMPKCPFRLLTGLSCPGCGVQRAIHALLHGDVYGAIKYNVFLVYSGPYAFSFIVQRCVLTGEWQRKVGDFIENKWLVNFYIVMFCVWFVLRNIIGI